VTLFRSILVLLLEINEAREAVARGDDLHEIIILLIDIEDIKDRIQSLDHEKSNINYELATIKSKLRNNSN